jgi:hypothetical protein
MKTYQTATDTGGRVFGFQIDNVYVSPTTCARILRSVDGVSDVRLRKIFTAWDETHVRFRYRDAECVVWEPHGDNSLYWIGQEKMAREPIDMSAVERAFEIYQPPIYRRIVGDVLTLRFLKRPVRRD